MSQSSASGFDSPVAQRWVERIARFNASNLSVAAFCDAEGVAKSGFFRWKRKLSNDKTTTRRQQPVVPLRLAPTTAANTAIELTRPSGTVLRFPFDTPPELLLAIVMSSSGHGCHSRTY